MDHKRLYSFQYFRQLFEQRGFEVINVPGIPAPFAVAIGDNRVARLFGWVNRSLIRISQGLFSYQIFLRQKSLPNLDYLLNEAERETEIEFTVLLDLAGTGH